MTRNRLYSALIVVTALFGLTGCSATVSDEKLSAITISASDFGPEWQQRDENAGDINFRGGRVGDLCSLDYFMESAGGTREGQAKMVIFDELPIEKVVYATVFSFSGGDEVGKAMQRAKRESKSCAIGDFQSSTANGILTSSSDTREFLPLEDFVSDLGLSSESVLAFEYSRTRSQTLLNTNNGYSDSSEYQSSGQVVLIAGQNSMLLITSNGQSFKNRELAPSMSDVNAAVLTLIRSALKG